MRSPILVLAIASFPLLLLRLPPYPLLALAAFVTFLAAGANGFLALAFVVLVLCGPPLAFRVFAAHA